MAPNNEKGRRRKNKQAGKSSSGGQSGPNESSANPQPSQPHNRKKSSSDSRRKNSKNESNSSDKNSSSNVSYSPHWCLQDCLTAYAEKKLVRGTLRVLPAKDAASFVTCDRGDHIADILIPTNVERNRGMNGDTVFVELEPPESEVADVKHGVASLALEDAEDAGDVILDGWQEELDTNKSLLQEDSKVSVEEQEEPAMWQDDETQLDLWNPVVPIVRRNRKGRSSSSEEPTPQRRGRVVHVVSPKAVASELGGEATIPTRRIVGSLKILNSGTILLTPNNKSLPQFKCPAHSTTSVLEEGLASRTDEQGEALTDSDQLLFQAEYRYGSWRESQKWPPCCNVQVLGMTAVLEDEIQALLVENNVNHGEFETDVLQDVDKSVQSGVYYESMEGHEQQIGWKPTPAMYKGRRDYRSERIFTIDPTTAKDLDDALHIKLLEDGETVEVGVHIADVSFFVRPDTAVDKEAEHRATTVYLVDRTVPMLPRPLCEVACSLNENVERLAFSCVWRMKLNGTLRTGKAGVADVWYGRSVIRSCARLDYSTAQNIIDGLVATGEKESSMDEKLWHASRRPTPGGPHTVDQVAADVRLMHKVAMARRRLRFANGALALHGVKLTFQLASDGQTPLMAAPYPIRDSNRLVEEYMLLANYLVAQRLITHAGGRAVLRYHPEPLMEGLDKVAAVAKAGMNYDIDCSTSKSLHASLVGLERECQDPLVHKCVTQMLMTPMQQAEYFVAGSVESELWRHFALNIPYYTHFTSPIRRYPDVLVHRLLQATLDDEVEKFPLNEKELGKICSHCNDQRMGSKNAQDRCDRVFLSLYVKNHPVRAAMGIVLSVGVTTFTVFIASLGVNAILFLEEHKDMLTYASETQEDGTKRILLQRTPEQTTTPPWDTLEIVVFTKLRLTVVCRERPPIDVKLRLEGPWSDS